MRRLCDNVACDVDEVRGNDADKNTTETATRLSLSICLLHSDHYLASVQYLIVLCHISIMQCNSNSGKVIRIYNKYRTHSETFWNCHLMLSKNAVASLV